MINKKLKELILLSFPVEYPPQELLSAHPYDFEEEENMLKPFLGKRWMELDLGACHDWETCDVCAFFSPTAIQYYLPGLLLSFLSGEARDNNELLLDHFCYFVLTIQLPLSPDDHHYETKKYLTNLNNLQKHVIALWIKEIEAVADNLLTKHDLEVLKDYWYQYLTPPELGIET